MATKQDTAQDRRLKLYAHLASIPCSLSALPQRAKLQLVEEVRQADFPVQFTDMNTANRKAWFAGRGTAMPDEWRALLRVHPWAHNAINGLLDGEKVPLPLRQYQREVGALDPQTRTVRARGELDIYAGEIVADLDHALKRKRTLFPFGCCLWCKTTIFVRVKRQKYCSPACTNKGNEAARKGKPERKEYMRQLMAKKRQKARREQSGSLRG